MPSRQHSSARPRASSLQPTRIRLQLVACRPTANEAFPYTPVARHRNVQQSASTCSTYAFTLLKISVRSSSAAISSLVNHLSSRPSASANVRT